MVVEESQRMSSLNISKNKIKQSVQCIHFAWSSYFTVQMYCSRVSVNLNSCIYCTAEQQLAPGWPQKRFCE